MIRGAEKAGVGLFILPVSQWLSWWLGVCGGMQCWLRGKNEKNGQVKHTLHHALCVMLVWLGWSTRVDFIFISFNCSLPPAGGLSLLPWSLDSQFMYLNMLGWTYNWVSPGSILVCLACMPLFCLHFIALWPEQRNTDQATNLPCVSPFGQMLTFFLSRLSNFCPSWTHANHLTRSGGIGRWLPHASDRVYMYTQTLTWWSDASKHISGCVCLPHSQMSSTVTPLILSRLHALRLCFLLTLFVRPDRFHRLPDSLRTLPLSRYLAALVSTRLTMLTFHFRIRFSCSRCLCLLTLLSWYVYMWVILTDTYSDSFATY
jgi:hypothetical protein